MGNIVTKMEITELEPGGCLGQRRNHLVECISHIARHQVLAWNVI